MVYFDVVNSTFHKSSVVDPNVNVLEFGELGVPIHDVVKVYVEKYITKQLFVLCNHVLKWVCAKVVGRF